MQIFSLFLQDNVDPELDSFDSISPMGATTLSSNTTNYITLSEKADQQ